MSGWGRHLLGGLLTLSSIWGLAGCQVVTPTYGTLTFDKPLVLVSETDQGAVLLSTPSAPEVDRFVQQVLPSNPGRYGYRQVYTPDVMRLERDGETSPIAFEQRAIAFTDPIRNEPRTLDVLVLDTPQGRQIVAEPGVSEPLIINPHQPNQVFFQDRNSDNLLYRLDPESLTVTPIQADALKAVRQQMAALPDRGEEMNPILHWMTDIRFSTDGRQIAFVSNRDRLTQNAGMDVWIHDLTSGAETKLLSRDAYTYQVHGWSADGRIILRQLGLAPGSREESILLLDPQTGGTEAIATGSPLSVSPDGRYLIYQVYPLEPAGGEGSEGQPSDSTFYLYDLTTKQPRLLYENTASQRLADGIPLDFSADGDHLVAVINQVNGSQPSQALWVYNLSAQQGKSIPLPEDWQVLNGSNLERVEWVSEHLLVPLEGVRERRSQTLILPVE